MLTTFPNAFVSKTPTSMPKAIGSSVCDREEPSPEQLESTMKNTFTAVIAASIVAFAGASTAGATSWQESILRMPVYSTPAATQSTSYSSQSYSQSYGKPKRAKKSARKAKRSKSARANTKSSSRGYSSGYSGGSSGGLASYYWQPQRVASGGWFNPNAMTAAHKTLPFGTKVRVTNVNNGRSVVVTINDRGPYIAGRVIDLSKAAAGVIGMQQAGVVPVRVQRL